MRTRLVALSALLVSFCLATSIWAAEPVEVPLNAAKSLMTGQHPIGLPSFFGPNEHAYAIFKFKDLVPGQRYEATISYESGTDIGFGHSWVDGDPFRSEYWSFTGIGTGTGTGPRRESQQKFLFTVDPKSSCSELYLVFRSHRPMALRVSLQRPSGVTRDSQDRYGYYYVTDFDVDRTAPFLLKRCAAPKPKPVTVVPGGFIDVPLNSTKPATTSTHPAALPSYFGPNDHYYSLFRFVGLVPGQRYEATISFESGTDIGFGHSWVDGNPFGKEYWSFTGIGTGTGTGPRRESQQTYLFTVAPASSSSSLYLVFRSHKPMPLRVSLRYPSGVTRDSQDRYGYYYVTDFDIDRTAPFLLKR